MSLSFTRRSIVVRHGQHLYQIADFNVRSQNAIADEQFDLPFAIFCLQLSHNFDGGIARIADSEDQLKLGILLLAVTAKTFPDFGIDASQGLEHGNWGELSCEQRRPALLLARVAEKTCQAARGEEVEKQTADRSHHSHSFKQESRRQWWHQ